MKKGQKLTFDEMYEWLSNNPNKKWRLFAVGGSFGFLNELRWGEEWITQYFERTDGGHKTFRFAAFDDECHFIQEMSFGAYEDLEYRIEVYNDNPLELLIEYRDGDNTSHFAIFQEL